ncbi:MAG: hypothetical protein PUH11_06290 [Bacilli bacterium]|nr:hypothetical protein [Bacilli bacterium]MDD7315318.1 hypothetical protein [Bacilli bacterium]MDY4052457.1 hypothetical protein [Bacilli bacterium]
MLTDNEKKAIKLFQQTSIPSVYKLDNTDNILYIEHVNFDLCNMLLKNKKANIEYVQNEIKEYAKFLKQLDISSYDNDTKKHLILLTEVINIFLRNNL